MMGHLSMILDMVHTLSLSIPTHKDPTQILKRFNWGNFVVLMIQRL